jgi:type II secretory pathway component PulF
MVVPAAGPILVYGLAFAGVVLMTWSAAQRAIRKRRVLLVLSALERSIGMNLPLAPMIRAAAESEKGKLRRRLFALHACLDRGEALDQALLDSVPEISLSTARAIGAGVRMGCPERMMGMLIRRQRRGEADRARIGFYWVYPLVIVAVVGLLMIAVIPKFQGIFPDFRVELPWTTRLLIELSRNGSVIAVAVVVLSLVPLGRALGRAAPGLRGMEPFGGAVGDQLLWWTPVVGGMMRDRSMGELCEMVSAGVDSGLGLNESLHEAAAAQSNAVMRDRASAWADGVARGESIHEAARYARMPRLVVAMLATVRNEGTMSQVLGFLRRHYDYRFSRARAIADAACVPAITFFFGAVVALVGASLMQPIAVLNENIARHILGGF